MWSLLVPHIYAYVPPDCHVSTVYAYGFLLPPHTIVHVLSCICMFLVTVIYTYALFCCM